MMVANDDSPYPNMFHHPQATGRYAGPYWSDDPHGWVANWYRHLAAPHIGRRNLGVVGYEDSDWELTFSASDHNDYREAYSTDGYVQSKSVSGFCAGCHQAFCNAARSGVDGQFHKHPAQGVVIPATGE